MESAISQPDLAKSVQRYQLTVDEAKVRLNLAVAPMAWLMPANMIKNTTKPNSHPLNPLHKAVMAVQDPKPAKKTPKQVRFKLPTDEVYQNEKPEPPHEINKTAVIVGAVAVVGLLVLASH